MKLTLALLFTASATAMVLPRNDGCTCTGFTLTASGGKSGTVGQLSDGQNRIGGPLPPATYSLCNGGVTDANGRGCILTPPTTQFQCDQGASPTGGFSIGSNGQLLHDGSGQFYACPTGDNGEYNLYSQTLPGEPNCVSVTLSTNCQAPAPPAPPAPSSCPADLNGAYEFPHLIIPIDSSQPNNAPGTSYFGQVSSTISSIFNFDIPASDSGKTCTLIFLFPTQSQLVTSSYTFSGNGGIDFAQLNSPATGATTYANAPGVKTDYGVTKVAPGNSYSIATFACPAGQTVAYEMTASGDTALRYFQDYNPSPIGLYIRVC